MSGAKFTVTATNVKSLNGEEANSSNECTLTDYSLNSTLTIVPATGNTTVKLTLEETKTPSGYGELIENIEVTITVEDYKSTNLTVNKGEKYVTTEENGDSYDVSIKNVQEVELNLKKIDAISGDELNGAIFNITLEGVDWVSEGTEKDGKYTINNYTLNGSSTLKFVPSVVSGIGTVTLTLEEKQPPADHDKAYGSIIIKITTKNGRLSIAKVSSGLEYVGGISIDKDANTMTLDIKNYKTIKVSGYVFLDGQFGDKDANVPNGKFDGKDKKVEGVRVELWVKRKNKDDAMEPFAYTDKDGAYNFTIENGQEVEYYYIKFIYNGVEYEDTIYYQYLSTNDKNLAGVSKAEEVGDYRTGFNNIFGTITLNKNVNKQIIDYGSWTRVGSSQIGTSKLNISMDGVGQVNSGDYYRMYAYTEKYSKSMENLNFGIKERGMNLALTMQVDHTDVTINGKTTKYDYTDININTNEELEKWLESVLRDNNKNMVNVDIYPTDYYYRINDYITGNDGHLNNFLDSDKKLIKDETLTKQLGKVEQDELDVKVTYKVRMFNQTAGIDAQIKQLVYYYNSDVYKLNTINSKADGTGTSYDDKWIDADNSYGTIDGYNGIVISGDWNVSNDEQYLYLTFTLNKDNVKEDLEYRKQAVIKGNIVAITSYYTTEGLLDRDSSTRSIVNGSEIQYEDDTARAEDVNINISTKVRTISGNVFEDSKTLGKIGILDNGEAINDVVVQLIEITKNNNEYIWQEVTVGKIETGNDGKGTYVTSLVRLNEGGYSAYKYKINDGNNEKGKYEFLNIVPGNYIVRFIYGDGYNYDITVGNTKYNGADYKSTIDPNYQSEWYNTAKYSANASVARDNEARRLEVMGVTSKIDSGLGTALNVYTKDKQLNSSNKEKELTDLEKKNIVSYIQTLAQNKDNELYAAISKVFNTTDTALIGNMANSITVDNLNDNYLDALKKCIAYKTFMAAETSKVNIPVDVSDNNALKTDSGSTTITATRDNYRIVNYNISDISFANVNFGITLRPQVKFELEKHITALKITPKRTGVAPVIDASANIADILNGNLKTSGENNGLATIKSTRDERGFWKVETAGAELSQGASLEVEYTYVVKNIGDEDYISNDLEDLYESNPDEYSVNLNKIANELKNNIKGKTHTYGAILGKYYYTGNKVASDVEVKSRVEAMGEALNNQLRYEESSSSDFTKVNTTTPEIRNIYNTDGVREKETIDTVVQTKRASEPLKKEETDKNKTLKLTTVLASLNLNSGENIPSYITEILKYSSASGGRDKDSTPGNLTYVHSKDTRITVENSNEGDEFWGETIMIEKSTGGNRVLPVQIGIIAIVSVAVIGVGLVLIRKFVLIK